MAAKRIDVPDSLFPEQPKSIPPTPLEVYLGRTRDPDTGKLVPKRKRSKAVAASTFDLTRVETQRMMDEREWEGCTSRHLVALYDIMYRKTYGVDVTMSGSERYRLTMIAGAFVKRLFGGDFVQAIEFFRWVWTREIGREKWRREEGREGGLISAGFMFSNRLYDQWRLDLARRSHRK